MLLKGKNAVITGGASGIGKSICLRLAEEGARIVIADRDEERGRILESEMRGMGREAWFVPLDAARVDSIQAMMRNSLAITGRIDVLVNNAAVTRRIPLLDISPEDWDWIQNINTRGLFFCLQEAARHMKEQGYGRIVNISSISGKGVHGSSNASYAASKAAAIVVARIAANELGPFNVNVNSVVPGPVRTEMLDLLEQQNPKIIHDMKAKCARREIASPQDIANAVVFLCSPLADSITGQSINVDNGLLWD